MNKMKMPLHSNRSRPASLSKPIMSVRRCKTAALTFLLGIFFGIFWAPPTQNIINKLEWSEKGIYYELSDHQKATPTERLQLSKRIHRKYLEEYTTKIDGWFTEESLYAIWTLSQFQYKNLSIIGNIGEIGVHHGRLASYLYLMRRYAEQKLFAVDVFEQQSLNKDGSGHGDRELFLKNIARYAHVSPNQVAMYNGTSMDLNPLFYSEEHALNWWRKEAVGQLGIQLISIDGGHTNALAYSDLCLASNALRDGGIVMVDDFGHSGWLGVRDGVGQFLAETSYPNLDEMLDFEMGKKPNETTLDLSLRIVQATYPIDRTQRRPCSRLVPFLQYYNRLFLTTPNYYPHYIQFISELDNFANDARQQGISYLEYHAYRMTVGNVPIWMENHELTSAQLSNIFEKFIKQKWLNLIDTSDHHFTSTRK